MTGIISIHPYLNTNHGHNHVPWSTRGREAFPIWEPFRNRNSLGNLGYVTQCSGTFIKRCRNKTTSKHHSAVYCQSVKPFSFLGTSKPLLNLKNLKKKKKKKKKKKNSYRNSYRNCTLSVFFQAAAVFPSNGNGLQNGDLNSCLDSTAGSFFGDFSWDFHCDVELFNLLIY